MSRQMHIFLRLIVYEFFSSLHSQNMDRVLTFSPLVNPESMTWKGASGKMKTLVTSMRTWWTWKHLSLPSSSRTMRRAVRAKTRMMAKVCIKSTEKDICRLCSDCFVGSLNQMAERGRILLVPQRSWSLNWRLWRSQMSLLSWRDQMRLKTKNWPKNCLMNKVSPDVSLVFAQPLCGTELLWGSETSSVGFYEPLFLFVQSKRMKKPIRDPTWS